MHNRRYTLFLVVPLLAACAMSKPTANATGQEIYAIANCADCHGDDFEGRFMGPSLKDVASHWNPTDLASFLAAPDNFIQSDPRLVALDDEYWFDMPDYKELSRRHRDALALWLLQQNTTTP
ncbi:MAG: cytochrome c [Planctomycetota bacterium]